MYYLDANAIYSYANKLDTIANHKERAFTSYLVVLEILSGIKCENSFRRRKMALKKLKESGLHIIWKTPNQIIARAFLYQLYCSDIEIVKYLSELVISSENYTEFKDKSDQSNDEYKIERVQKYDDYISDIGVSESKEVIRFINENNSKIVKNAYKKNVIENDFIPSLALKHSHQSIVNQAVAIINDDPFGSLEEIMTNYDRSLDLYYYVDSFHTVESKLNSEVYGKNDFMDHNHLLYLDSNRKIVSDDKLLKKLALKTKCYECIGAHDFMAIIGNLE